MKANVLVLAVIYTLISEIKTNDDYDIDLLASTCGSGTQSYCVNCRALNLCPANENPFIALIIKSYEELSGSSFVECPTEQTCIESGSFAYCDAPSSTCTCPSQSGVTTFCDPFNEKFVITCYNGVIQEFATCLETNTKCIDGACAQITTLAPGSMTEAPAPSCTPSFSVSPKNCTSYYVCVNGKLVLETCPDNKRTKYDGSLVTCVDYTPFKCPTSGIGKFRDSLKCNVYYNCQNGNQIGPAQSCNAGQKFDDSSQTCALPASVDCNDIKCTPCTDSNMRFKVNCTSYYECSKDSDYNYVTELRTCPPSLVYDPTKKFCTNKPVSGC